MKALTGKEMLKLLRKYGWVVERIHGSHYIHTKPGREEIVSVPVHGNRTPENGDAKRNFESRRNRYGKAVNCVEREV